MVPLIKKLPARFRRVLKFGACGVINTLVDYLVFTLCYYPARLGEFPSQLLGFLAGSVCGFFLNSRITFREGRGRSRGQFLQYLGVDAALMLLSGLGLEALAKAGVNVYLAKIGMTAAIFLIHYVTYKYLVFRIKKEDDR